MFSLSIDLPKEVVENSREFPERSFQILKKRKQIISQHIYKTNEQSLSGFTETRERGKIASNDRVGIGFSDNERGLAKQTQMYKPRGVGEVCSSFVSPGPGQQATLLLVFTHQACSLGISSSRPWERRCLHMGG